MSTKQLAVLLGNQVYDTNYCSLHSVPFDLFLIKSRLELDGWATWAKLNFDSKDARILFEKVGKEALSFKSKGFQVDLLLYYAGHGLSDAAGGWKPVLREEGTNNLDLLGLTLDLATGEHGIARVFVLLDSCESAQISANALTPYWRTTSKVPSVFVLAAAWRETRETQQSGVFTTGLLNCLARPARHFPETWNCLKDEINREMPEIIREADAKTNPKAACELFRLGNADASERLPFHPKREAWPVVAEAQLDFILRHAEPQVAFGALFGASKSHEARSPDLTNLRPEVLGAAADFGIHQEGAGATHDALWDRLKRFTLVPASPFQSVADISSDVMEALTITLAQLLLKKMPTEKKPTWARRRGASSQIQYRQAQDVVSRYNVSIVAFNRLSYRFRLLIALCALETDNATEVSTAIGLRFAKRSDRIDNAPDDEWPAQDAQERIERELDGIEAATDFYKNSVGIHEPITITLPTEGKKDIGVAYTLDIVFGPSEDEYGGVQTLTTLMTDALAKPDANALRRLVELIQEIFRSLFQGLGGAASKWRLSDRSGEHSLRRKIVNWKSSKDFEEIVCGIEHMEGEDFCGRLKTNSFLSELRSIREFISNLENDNEMQKIETILSAAHGDMHQKNIIIPKRYLKIILQKDDIFIDEPIASLIDFESANGIDHAFTDLASLEASVIIFFLEDAVGLQSLTRIVSRIEGEWLPSPGSVPSAAGIEREDLKSYAQTNFEREDYNAYEKVAHAIVGTIRRFLRNAIFKAHARLGSEMIPGGESPRLTEVPSHNELKGYLRHYYILMFISTVKLIAVPGAPKAVVVSYAYWLANQLRTDPDLMVEQ